MDFCCREDSTLGVAVGDVSGHGISAALLMSTTRAFLRSRVNQPGGLGDIMNDVNVLLSKDTGNTGEFVTLFYTEINRSRSEIRWVRAGHDPALLYDPQGDRFEEIQGEGLAMGIDPSFHYAENVKYGLVEGQIVVIGTDGIWETRNGSGEMFGRSRLKDLIRSNYRFSADQILSSVIDALEDYREDTKQADDVTLVVIKINGSNGPGRLPS
jgi:sigma-B regulation protein RsbU (phosphoserine phosphatase)